MDIRVGGSFDSFFLTSSGPHTQVGTVVSLWSISGTFGEWSKITYLSSGLSGLNLRAKTSSVPRDNILTGSLPLDNALEKCSIHRSNLGWAEGGKGTL